MFILLYSNIFFTAVVFWMRNIGAWLNSVPAAVWWIQSDTVPKHGLVSASVFDRVPLSASVKCSEMSTYINV